MLDKLLFGSDSPMVAATSAAAALEGVVDHLERSSLTAITDEELHNLLHRPSFDLLGIDMPELAPAGLVGTPTPEEREVR